MSWLTKGFQPMKINWGPMFSSSAFFLCLMLMAGACNRVEPTQLGLNLQPEEDLVNAALVDTMTLDVMTVQSDSVIINQTGTFLFGTYRDPLFGEVRATGILGAYPGALPGVVDNTFTIPSVTTDSAQYRGLTVQLDPIQPTTSDRTRIPIDSNFYGNLFGQIAFTIHPLKNGFSRSNTNIYTSKDPVKLDLIDYNRVWHRDTIKNGRDKLPYRFNLDSLGAVVWRNRNTFQLNDAQPFIDAVKGIAFVPNSSASDMVAGINIYQSSSPGIRMWLKIGYPNTSRIDSVPIPFSTLAGHMTYFEGLNRPAPLASLTADGQVIRSNRGYIQGGTGLRTVVKFPNLEKLKAELGNIVIIRAELVVPPAEGTTDPYFLPTFLNALRNGSDDKPAKTDALIYNDGLRGASVSSTDQLSRFFYNPTQAAYLVNMTTYFGDVWRGTFPNDGITLIVGREGTRVSRVAFPVSGVPKEKKIRLRLYYSKT